MKGALAFVTVLFIMPLGHAVTVLALRLPHEVHMPVVVTSLIAAVVIIFLTKKIKSPAWETFVGMLAGVLLWSSLVEMGVREEGDGIYLSHTHSPLHLFRF